jgi:hypothetical protein
MRLRPLTEAECYARCYGGHRGDRVSVLPAAPKQVASIDRVRELFEERPGPPPAGEAEAA